MAPARWVKLATDIASRRDLAPAAKLVLAFIIDHLGNNRQAWPGIRMLAAEAGLSERGVRNAIDQMCRVGVLGVRRQRGRVNKYYLRLTAAQSAALTPAQSAAPPGKMCRTSKAECAENQGTKCRRTRRLNRQTKEPEAPPSIPASLDHPSFISAWNDYRQHRKEIKKPLTPTAEKRQLARMEKLGLDRAIAATEHSIAQGWRGIFEEKDGEVVERDAKGRPVYDDEGHPINWAIQEMAEAQEQERQRLEKERKYAESADGSGEA